MTTHLATGDLPDPDQRAALNAALTTAGTDTGFWDQHGTPAHWPDDINDWRPDTNPSNPF